MNETDARKHAKEASKDGEPRFVVWDDDYETFRVVKIQTAGELYEESDVRVRYADGKLDL